MVATEVAEQPRLPSQIHKSCVAVVGEKTVLLHIRTSHSFVYALVAFKGLLLLMHLSVLNLFTFM